MTFTDIVSRITGRLNLTQPEATTRVGQFVNERHQRAQTSLGLAQVRRTVASPVTTSGNHNVTPTNIIKVFTVTDAVGRTVLGERSLNELRLLDPNDQQISRPTLYAVTDFGPTSVTLYLYPKPNAMITLTVDGLASGTVMAGTDVPGLTADFHDMLIYGGLADEYYHRAKLKEAEKQEENYERRLSDYRYFLAKSAYLTRVQNAHYGYPWYNNTGLVP